MRNLALLVAPLLALIALAGACGGGGSPTPGSGDTDKPADVVALFAGPETARAILAAAKGLDGVQLYLLPSSAAGDGAFDQSALPGAEVRGVRPSFPDMPEFRERYAAAFTYPDPVFPGFREAYDAVYLAASAVLAAGTADPAVVRDNIGFVANPPGNAVIAGPTGFAAAVEALTGGSDVDFAGASGLFDLDSTGAASKATVETWTVLNGAVAPLEFRDVDLVAEIGARNPAGALMRPGEPKIALPVKIGAILSLSGSGQERGIAAHDAMQLAVEEINSAGGVYGQRIELLVKDDGSEASGAAGAAGALREAGVTAIIGPLDDAAAEAVAAAVPEDSAVPVLALSPSAALAAVNKPAFFRVTPSETIETVVLANLARDRELAVACVLYEDAEGPKQMAEAFRAAFEHKGGSVRKPVALADGADYSGIVAGCRGS